MGSVTGHACPGGSFTSERRTSVSTPSLKVKLTVPSEPRDHQASGRVVKYVHFASVPEMDVAAGACRQVRTSSLLVSPIFSPASVRCQKASPGYELAYT